MAFIKWVLFDLGGVFLPETRDLVLTGVAQSLGTGPSDFIETVDSYFDKATAGKITLLELYKNVIHDLSIDADAEEVLACHLDQYRGFSESIDTNMISLVEQLKEKHSVACLTNTESEIAEISRETGLFDHFDRAYLSVELGLIKPDPDIYKAVAADLECSPEEILFVDDREDNAEAARLTGMQAVCFTNIDQLRKDLSSYIPDFNIEE